ncbi:MULTISPECIES: nitrate- and nitrite sensing domain-containing protein [unclassified Streptomyces]|uniref:sensor histidine kinase n=1 Tax=unclassified Streptomyces TaxID=2593676 RepID=UPI002E819684|nr:nitrate- and nitrite sensing domain-containing protein [Streptomyces sp. NBC_00589]WTI36277.1 nitrate- and nitrite sensing domain-containing protein [Streptomyces sp. NBC_00775]WUB30048.1 nitrate- and nitrite sensing domain-containing protein [Streptomyces sp. NBC_00589]
MTGNVKTTLRLPTLRLPALPGWHSIRGRMAIVLAVPTCLLLALTGLGVADRAADWSAARATEAHVGVLLRVQDLVRELQRERGLTNGLLGGAEGYRDDVRRQRGRTDDARSALRAALSEESGDLPGASASALRDAQLPLADLATLRADVDSGAADRTATLTSYTKAVTALIDAESAGAPQGDRRIGDGVQALQALARATEAVALERGSLNGVFAAKRFRSGEYLDFTEIRATRVAGLGQFRQLATHTQESALDTAFKSTAARRVTSYERQAEGGADGSALVVPPSRWWADMTTLVDDLHGVQKRVGADVRARAAETGDAATRQLVGFLGLGALIVAVAAALAVISARSITRPLGALADEADAVAGTRLPVAVKRIQENGPATLDASDIPNIPIATGPAGPARPRAADHGAREITRLAAALRNVERTAVGLAAEQAVLRRNSTESLAGLGRRNQALLRRQLGLITTLESQELDPDALAELFELDHLATRMRRNAESLLVLAGEESPARSWPGTVAVADVVRSAVSEVEQYRRVAAVDIEQCGIRGHAVAELSHMLAELVENALMFSPPGQPVQIYGWRDGAEYCLAVVDQGIGMTEERMTQVNALLSGNGGSFLAAPTLRRVPGSARTQGMPTLGHHVVGALAARLGAQVELRPTRGAGVTAYIALPAALVEQSSTATVVGGVG